MKKPKALFFDVFGTLVDWRNGVARESRVILQALGHDLDWHAFADAWRDEYQPGMEEIRSGRQSFAKLDVVHRRNLERILPRFGLERLPEDVRANLAPVSNGNISLMVALKRHNSLPFDAILGSEIAHDFKPKPRVYLAACEAFDLPPGDCMMVAAHSADLAAAAECGLMTGFVARPDERGPGRGESEASVPVDASGRDLIDLAQKILG